MKPAFFIASLPPDIAERIRVDYPGSHAEVTRELEAFITEHNYLSHPRIVRCILFLAKARNKGLEWSLKAGAGDPRDVMLWAEYEGWSGVETPRQVRDFNKPFGQNDV